MAKFSRSATLIVAVFVTMSGSNALCQETEKADPAGSATETSGATAESGGPIRPRRGHAPTLDRISGVTVDVNPDGTMTRRTEILGNPVPGLEDAPVHEEPGPALERDPSYTPPTHATVSSINNDPPANGEAAATTPTAATETRKDYSLLAGSGVCILIAVVLWLTLRQPRESD